MYYDAESVNSVILI